MEKRNTKEGMQKKKRGGVQRRWRGRWAAVMVRAETIDGSERGLSSVVCANQERGYTASCSPFQKLAVSTSLKRHGKRGVAFSRGRRAKTTMPSFSAKQIGNITVRSERDASPKHIPSNIFSLHFISCYVIESYMLYAYNTLPHLPTVDARRCAFPVRRAPSRVHLLRACLT